MNAAEAAAPVRHALTFPLDGRELTIGRGESCDIRLSGVGVSRMHARVKCQEENAVVVDNDSTFGTRLNGEPVKEAVLSDGSALTIGVQELRVSVSGGEIVFTLIGTHDDDASSLNGEKSVIRIGRDPDNDICLPHPMVSRFHAVVRSGAGGLTITDLGSANSTYVNGRAAGTAQLSDGDAVHVGPFRFYVSDGKFCKADNLDKIKIEAHALSVRLKRSGKRLLDNINLTIEPGAFVALLGASGAGKSTLSKVLSGQLAPTSGRLFMNGFPASKFSAAFERSVGYVSQQVLLRPELTVWETLTDQSLIRLPIDSTEKERLIRADEVLELMDLSRLRHHRVSSLSGGEARRLHVGVELLASPAVVILDEPLAGLDPGLIGKFMRLFRCICDKGHTLILITHTLEQIELCDRIVYMQAGRALFSGPPKDLCGHFKVSSLAEVYGIAGTAAAAAKNAERQQNTEQITPKQLGQHPPRGEWANALRHPLQAVTLFARQAAALTSRYSKVYMRDRRNMLLLLVQTPLITLLLGLVYTRRIQVDYLSGFYFCLAITGIWVGGLAAVREVASELPMLAREVKCGLNRLSYIVSRVAVSAALSAAQAALFAVFTAIIFSNDVTFSMELLILLFTAVFAGSLLGLAVSACSGGVSRAISTLPIVLIPQIFFSGVMIKPEYMTEWGRQLSHLMISRPVFDIMKKVFLLDADIFWHKEWTSLTLLCAAMTALFWLALQTRTGRRAGGL